jgi:hypothetical protein
LQAIVRRILMKTLTAKPPVGVPGVSIKPPSSAPGSRNKKKLPVPAKKQVTKPASKRPIKGGIKKSGK